MDDIYDYYDMYPITDESEEPSYECVYVVK